MKPKPSFSDEAVQKATGKNWDAWFALLKKNKSEDLNHTEIARTLHDVHHLDGWWAQNITVEFERHIGRREVGQNCEGDFQTAVSKTMAGTMDEALNAWQKLVARKNSFNEVAFADEPSSSTTEKWRYWRVKLEDGSRVNININQKTSDKTQLAVNHIKLQGKEDIERWKKFWKGFFLDL